jgi:DnaJ-domain-containing protein 1
MADDRFESLRDRLLHHGRASVVPRPLGDGATAQALYERLRPFAEAVFLVMAADASIDQRETEVLRGTLRLLTAGELGGSALDAMLKEFAANLQRDGRELRLDRVASEIYGDRDDVELAISLVSAAALANGCIEPAEDEVIVELAERLGLSKARLSALCSGELR